MPATESTWRNQHTLHRVFAVTGVVLTIGTLWMFWKDHARSWKQYQVAVNNIDLKMNAMRQEQFETGDAVVEHGARASELAAARALPLNAAAIERFKSLALKLDQVLADVAQAGYPYSTVGVDDKYIETTAAQLERQAAEAQERRMAANAAQQAADRGAEAGAGPDGKAQQERESALRNANRDAQAAESAAAATRARLVAYLQRIVDDDKIREDKALGVRKFKSADIDKAKADVDIAIRDAGTMTADEAAAELARREKIVNDLVGKEGDWKQGKSTLTALTEVYQSISGIRKELDGTLKGLTAEVDAAQKRYEESVADLDRLQKQYQDREEKYVEFAWGFVPYPGKKVLTLPILDAFSSPRKIENLWSDGLTQSYNFSYVRRFDRCTTCHQSLTKTLPGSATDPAYVRETSFDMLVSPPPKDAPPKPRVAPDGSPARLNLEDWLGVRLADAGLLNSDDITVGLVLPKTPAAKAQIAANLPSSSAAATGLEIRREVARLTTLPESSAAAFPKQPGLMVGDVIEAINGDPLPTSGGERGPKRIAARLIALAEEGQPITLTIRRGLPNPYTSHPRLDLYVGDASPHRMQTFACTICHDGQGSGTDFNWVSHTPSTTTDMKRWAEEHGWFDNPHWIYPMYARRFIEASCLKCHHDVVELESSERFPAAPAPKVTHGYHLIRKYGCYGCHEVNGYDGPSKRIGPDLRSEPNYFAVAQQIEAELLAAERAAGNSGASSDSVRERLQGWKAALQPLTAQVASHPEDNQARQQLKAVIEERVAAAPESAPLDRSLASLANMLKDVEVPGTLRRAGPSLRYIASKADNVFLYDWIADPQHFRPTTRMPRFFGLWDHLKDAHGELHDAKAPRLEPIEIRGVIEYFQSYAADQKFAPEPRPSGISSWTSEERIARGKTQFQTRGCLACHSHKDFPDAEKYRNPDEIVQGPDLSGVGSKFAEERNPQGPEWLYSWIKNPAKYHTRTVMPNVFLDPQKDPGANANSSDDDKWFDPADDIVTYLLTSSTTDWQPIPQALGVTQPLNDDGQRALQDLTLEYLNEAFYRDAAEQYYVTGIPAAMEGELKGAEKDLIVASGQSLSDQQRLKYIGRKTIAKYGCFGCHDIPGFEDAKPIGTGLADWGRKDPARLAFEHITHYLEHGHGAHAPPAAAVNGAPRTEAKADALYAESKAKSRAADPTAADHSPADHGAAPAAAHQEQVSEETASFYHHALEAGNRIGFIYQKLLEPRSYDFEKTENKRYNERLRMPQFPFTAHEREAVITFVLGLVADPPQPKYVFQAKGRNAAIVAGKQVLEKYNCGGCHILELEKWNVSYNPGDFGERTPPAMFDFLKTHVSQEALAAAAKPDRRNELTSTLHGLLPTDKADGLPMVVDTDGLQLDGESPYSPRELKLGVDLYRPSIVDGSLYITGQAPVFVPTGQLDARYPTWGGALTKYLLPEVTRLERQANPNASGAEAYGWLPPPLIGEGHKVQTAWLHDFLLEPYAIRPAVFLRMPKFNMSSAEATALANYFAAADNAEFPYTYASGRDRSRLQALEASYVNSAKDAPAPAGAVSAALANPAPPGMQRLDDAMKIVVNGNFCVKCHLVADFEPAGSERAKAPNLAEVYRRLRPDYLRDWIANPKMILPYTSMPVNIPYENPPAVLGQLYHGTGAEQIEALTDLLMNFDQYARQSTTIADRVQPAPAEGTPPAAASGGAGAN